MINEEKLRQTASEIKRHFPKKKFVLIVFETGEILQEYKCIHNSQDEDVKAAILAYLQNMEP